MFANNGWIERNPIPAAFASWGTFNELSERNTLVLKGIPEHAAAQAATTTDSSTRKLGTVLRELHGLHGGGARRHRADRR